MTVRRTPLLGVMFAVLVAPVVAAAAEEAKSHAAHGVGELFWPILNFAIFVYVLYRYAWPVVKTALADRRVLIEKALRESDEIRREAEAERRAIEEERARFPEESARLLRQVREEAEGERTRIVDAARGSAERIQREARIVADQEAARALRAIRDAVAAEVVKRAETLVRERLSAADQQRFVGRFLADVDAETPA